MKEQRYHFVGIGGIGMSGLARILLQRQARVSGSDLSVTAVTESLQADGADLYYGHAASHVSSDQTVVYSSDIQQTNPELIAAKQLQCRTLHRAELLAELMGAQRSIAVTGTHGKTSTTALLTWVLKHAGLDPSYMIGGLLAKEQRNAGHGRGVYFVAEADESDGSFLKYSPFGAIITNIDLDHMSHYRSEENLIAAFRLFAQQVTSFEHLFWCGDDVRLKRMDLPGNSYGFSESCDLRISSFTQVGWRIFFTAQWQGQEYRDVEVALTGRHNGYNALAVFGMALRLGVPEAKIREALRTFPGVARRCEHKGNKHQVLILDDYAHHPTEIRTTLAAIRKAIGPRRLIAVYQPHRYSRTQECVGLYAGMCEGADEVIVTDIYAAREAPVASVSPELVLRELRLSSRIPCRYVPHADVKKELLSLIRPHDVVVTLGAGDITKLSGELAAHFKRKAPKKLVVGVICGGISTEHKVTLLSTRQVLPKLNKGLYSIRQFGVRTDGHWLEGKDVLDQLEEEAKSQVEPAQARAKVRVSPLVLKKLLGCDVLVPILHGTFGEDGVAQGFLEVLGKAYVGCDTRAGAISMDKAVSKKLCLFHGIRTAPFVSFSHVQWQEDRDGILSQIQKTLAGPLWAKPSHLGSSVEVHRVESVDALLQVLERIFRVDTHAIVESEVVGRELEVALLGNDEVFAFPPGEVFTGARVYDYDGKYSSGGTPTAQIAEISPEIAAEGMELAKQIYRIAGCSGLARIDFFLDSQGCYWFNEINSFPGFTRNSLYPRMCEANGLQVGALFDQLIVLAMQRRRSQDQLVVRT